MPGTGGDDQVQHQQRTNTLTNREVLELAASELQTADLPAAEKDALGIFQQRLAKLDAEARYNEVMEILNPKEEQSLDSDGGDAVQYQVTFADYSPRFLDGTITALTRRVENGLSGSDGKDCIYLSQFRFCNNVNESLLLKVLRTKQPVEKKHITESNRYSETRKCCVFTASYVLVAREKHGVLEKSPRS